MVPPHGWEECRPAILAFDNVDPAHARAMDVAVQQAFDQLSDDERRLFHRFTCKDDRSAECLAVLQRISDTARAAMMG